jgi:hypothetical protein
MNSGWTVPRLVHLRPSRAKSKRAVLFENLSAGRFRSDVYVYIRSLDPALIEESQLTRAYQLLQTIPGIRDTAAAPISAESGPDMQQFR